MKIGIKIKKLRELKGIPQKEMARKLKLSLNGYSKIEREEVEPTITRLELIGKILEIDTHLIIDFDVDLFLNSFKELNKNKKLVEDLKNENIKLWSLLNVKVTKVKKKSPVNNRGF